MVVINKKTNLYIVRTKKGKVNLLPGKNVLTKEQEEIWIDSKNTKDFTKNLLRIGHLVEQETKKEKKEESQDVVKSVKQKKESV